MAKKSEKTPTATPLPDSFVIKILKAVQPGDIVFIECDEARNTQQLQHLTTQLKGKLPDVRIVILNKGARVAEVQTLATVAPT